MKTLISIFGEGDDLTVLQMSLRGIVIFCIALLLIRISGRRSFGIKTSLDTIISLLLGAILSRAIVGASPFLAVVVTCFMIVLLHRLVARLIIRNRFISEFMVGKKILLFEKGHFIEENLRRGLLCKEDVFQGIRMSLNSEKLEEIERVYMERNGEISTIKKKIAD